MKYHLVRRMGSHLSMKVIWKRRTVRNLGEELTLFKTVDVLWVCEMKNDLEKDLT